MRRGVLAASQEPQCPLSDPQAQGSPEPRLPRARKLARPQGSPFIALFPLSAIPPGPGLSKFLPLPPLPPPHPVCPQPRQDAGFQPSRDPLLRSRCSGSQIAVGLRCPLAGKPRPECPHSRASRLREFINGNRTGPPGGGARRGGANGIKPSGVSQRCCARNSLAFQNVGACD